MRNLFSKSKDPIAYGAHRLLAERKPPTLELAVQTLVEFLRTTVKPVFDPLGERSPAIDTRSEAIRLLNYLMSSAKVRWYERAQA